ncbi:THO complex component (Rlr1) [Penicillium paradoxum]|uniref:THO complex component (Rlr1) n=1 Tax=Penicillium paradoxum TaxID=176176 RepID=UPI002548F589|nr:THO complex component (Rlr1) [Penicillium paradoxum]KAJ5795032.1 THO complex component (Rlr1) [Penicillium paradoxum]
MAPGFGHGGKRKRPERTSLPGDSGNNDSLRPSPHRPGTLNMAHHPTHPGQQSSPPREQNDTRDRSRRQSHRNRAGSRRGSYDGQNFSSSQSREPNAMSPPPITQPREAADPIPYNGDSAASRPTLSPASNTPASQPPVNPPSRAGSETIAQSASLPSPYDYEFVTDNAVEEWTSTGKQMVVEEGTAARLQQDLAHLASVYQELIRSAIHGRLSPSDAGNAVREIIGEDSASQNMNTDADSGNPPTQGLDPRSLFLDTLSIMTDADTSNVALKPLVFATGIDASLMRLQLDTPLLQALGLVRETFARMGIRKQTNLLYRQSNYNLLREESEGYSKLLTELFTTSNNEPPSSEVVQDTFERVKAMIGAFDMDVGRVLDVTLDVFAAVLVKQYRFFVKLLRASSWWPKEETHHNLEKSRRHSGIPNWALPGSSGWSTSEEDRLAIMHANEERDSEFWDRVREIGLRAFFEIGRKPITDEEKQRSLSENNGSSFEEDATRAWLEETGTLPPKGNRVAAQLLGFKLRFYSSSARNKADVLPDNLIYLAALLIKVGFISLRDLYAHLWRSDDDMETLKGEKMAEKAERIKAGRPGGGINALMMAGALSDDTVPPPRLRDEPRVATPAKDQEPEKDTSNSEDELPDPSDQKVLLLKSLLSIGAIPESLFVISKFPWLMEAYPELPEFIHRILHHSLNKVYVQFRPVFCAGDFPGSQPLVTSEQNGQPKGRIGLTPRPARRVLRWAQLDKEDTNDGTDYRFYWDDWADNIPICQSVDDVFALCSSFLNLSGHKIGQDASLLAKLARIGKGSLIQDKSEENRTRWRDLCKRLLLPAVSLTKANPGVVNEVFDLISFFPRDVRYNMYAEWYSGQTSRLPDIKEAFDQARAETKDTLKRLSKTNIRPMARALAKIAYANPGIVINVAISQIESYENLIEVVVECARYFTYLGYDILSWALINSLGQKGRSRVQEGGLLTSRWLNALSTFAGRTYKRYSVMDPTPVLQYVVEQLRRNNSTDLIVLEQLISSMAGIISDNDFNDAQIQAMAGGDVLQSQTILQLLDKRHESKVTSKRLLKSLTHTRLAGQLLVAIAQERLTCVYKETSSELKLLGNIFDEIHRILTQYLDLLRSNLSVDEFDSFVPAFSSLVAEFGIQPEIAFWIRRPSIARKILDIEESKQEKEGSTAVGTDFSSKSDGDNKMDTAEDGEPPAKSEEILAGNAMDIDKDESGVTVANDGADGVHVPVVNAEPLASNPVMQELIDDVKSALPAETWDTIGAHFYATFWQLSLYDVHIPQKSYEDEIDRLKRRVVSINSDRSDMSMAGTTRKEHMKRQVTQLQERILDENKNHLKAYGQTRSRLQKEKDKWFAGMRLKHDSLNIALLEQCFIPRLLLSPLDAFFSFKMLKFLHSSGTPNFRTVGLLDQLFREQRLTALIFLCTSKEADNLGRFLNELLRDLTRWHADKAVYEKEAFGAKRDLPGFAKNVDPEGVPVMFLEFEDFRRLLYKWHRLFSNALKSCLNSGEYMHIRNAISVLKAVVQHFPAVNWIGRDILHCVDSLSKNDERDDVKIPAASLIGDLNRREKKWMLPQAFYFVAAQPGSQPPADATGKPGTPQSGSTPLNASAAEFNPAKPEGTAKQDQFGKTEVEDGEIEDAKMTDRGEGKPTSTPSQAGSTTPSVVTGDIGQDAAFGEQPPVRSRPHSRAPGSSRQPDIPKRPDIRQQIHPPVRPPPRHSDGRLPPRPEGLDDRRDRHPDFGPRGRHGGPDHNRSFDGSLGDVRGRLNEHLNEREREREFPLRPPPDDLMRGPPRDARANRENGWPMDRPSRMRGPGPNDSFHGRDAPIRGELMPDHMDRPLDIPRRGDPSRPDKEDRRPYPSRPLSPPRPADLPNRPERFPPPDDRRPAGFPQSSRIDDLPRGPRVDRQGDPRDNVQGPDMTHGRLRQPEPPSDIPAGPRGRRGGRNAPGQAPPMLSSSNATMPVPDRLAPTGPGRQGGRVPSEQPAPPTQPSGSTPTPGIHPDRLRNLVNEPAAPAAAPSGPRASGPQQPPRGPSGQSGQSGQSGPPGQGFGGERGRGDKRFAGLNNMLQQSGGGGGERGGNPPPVRGRGANRQSNAMEAPSPQPPNRPPMGPAGPQEDQSRNRPNGGRGGDLIDDLVPDAGRSGRSGDRAREMDPTREKEPERREGSSSGRNRRDGRRNDRERSRRSDVGTATRDEKATGEPRETLRRVQSSREEMRRRDRRDRPEGPPEMTGPTPGNNDAHEAEGRLRPPSSMGAPPPPPPPPPPPMPEGNERRFHSGADRGNRSDNRDRERERRGDRRDRDHHREGGSSSGGSGHRKRGRQGPDDNTGGDGGRGMRMGNDNKRPRRGA